MRTFWFLYVSLFIIGSSSYALSSCADKSVRANSPCNTTSPTCETYGLLPKLYPNGTVVKDANGNPIMFMAVVNCGNIGGTQFPGSFQCDVPSTGTDCQGSGSFAPCQTTWNCTKQISITDPRQFVCNPGSSGASTTAETKVTVPCPGTP